MEKYMSTDNLNKINGNKDLYDRLCTWMADIEDHDPQPEADEVTNLDSFINDMLDQAMEIMYDIYQTCEEN